MKSKNKNIFQSIACLVVMLVVFSCANKGQGPTGGKKDETPPRVVKELPANGSLNFTKKGISIQFDENISLEKIGENVIISPPQKIMPAINAYGKNLYVDFNDDLLDSTTYSIDFGNAIVDLNEKNPLENFVFAFATGNEIDTLRISGTLINAEDLNPISGIIVGIYTEMNDSVFTQKPFLRVGRTNSKGEFSISNVKAGKYKIFALGDLSRDYFYQQGEGLALYDSIVIPTVRTELMRDTVWKDSITVDTITEHIGNRFLPDDILMQFFRESKKRQYFVKVERRNQMAFSLFFNTKADSLPTIKPLNFDWEGKYIVQRNNTLDSITYWMTDSLVWGMDTLKMEMTYFKTDSVFELQAQTDTISAIYRQPRNQRNRKPESIKLNFKSNVASTFEIYNPIKISFDEPIQAIDLSKIMLQEKIDTIFKNLPLNWQIADSSKMNYTVSYAWEPEKSYLLTIDSAAFQSIYGKTSDKYTGNLKIRSLEEYSSLRIVMNPFNPNIVIQVLDTKDAVLASKPATEKGTLFEHLKPTDYYIRMFIDENGNGKWDPGSLSPRKHPEQVHYYPKKLTLMANWEFEETWDWGITPLLEQKPAELIKDASAKK